MRLTDSTTVWASQGRRVRRSMSSQEMPSCSHASSQAYGWVGCGLPGAVGGGAQAHTRRACVHTIHKKTRSQPHPTTSRQERPLHLHQQYTPIQTTTFSSTRSWPPQPTTVTSVPRRMTSALPSGMV